MFDFTRKILLIGRDPSSGFHLEDRSVSHQHAILELQGDQFVLQNCSKHGTQVNGSMITRRVLSDHDVITLVPGIEFEFLLARAGDGTGSGEWDEEPAEVSNGWLARIRQLFS